MALCVFLCGCHEADSPVEWGTFEVAEVSCEDCKRILMEMEKEKNNERKRTGKNINARRRR